MTTKHVTEADFRMPEFRDAKPEDYEFRNDGQLVLKDQYLRGLQAIASMVCEELPDFEVADVVAAVKRLAVNNQGWTTADWDGHPDPLAEGFSSCTNQAVSIRLANGSVLHGAVYGPARASLTEECEYRWLGMSFPPESVVAWKEPD